MGWGRATMKEDVDNAVDGEVEAARVASLIWRPRRDVYALFAFVCVSHQRSAM